MYRKKNCISKQKPKEKKMKLNRIIFHLKIDDVHFIVTRKCICCESYAMAYFQIFRHKKSEMRKIERERERKEY